MTKVSTSTLSNKPKSESIITFTNVAILIIVIMVLSSLIYASLLYMEKK